MFVLMVCFLLDLDFVLTLLRFGLFVGLAVLLDFFIARILTGLIVFIF